MKENAKALWDWTEDSLHRLSHQFYEFHNKHTPKEVEASESLKSELKALRADAIWLHNTRIDILLGICPRTEVYNEKKN